MSLILDALRRAEAERERGAVPGLHAQQVAPAIDGASSSRAAPWLWLAVAAIAVLLAVLAWMLLRPQAPAVPATAAATAPTAAPVAAAPAASAPQPAATAPPPAATPPPASMAPAREPQPVAEPAPWSQPEPRKPATAAAAAPGPAPQAPAANVPLPRREQLPENLRAQLPPLVVSGSIHSPNPADRSLILDGRLLRENDRLAPDLVLESIGARTAVLQFKGVRFEIGF